MNIQRINTYQDSRFSQKVLYQHGCFLIDHAPYEVEILSDSEALIRGANPAVFMELIDEFRFYTPHITRFYDENHHIIKAFPPKQPLSIPLNQIQPSQFYVDEDKIAAISTFIRRPEDIIIQVLPHQEGYLSLDGHTRLYYAVMKGWESVRAVADTSDDWVHRFVAEARKRNIHTPKDLILVSHSEYEEKWNRFCDAFFAETRVEAFCSIRKENPMTNLSERFCWYEPESTANTPAEKYQHIVNWAGRARGTNPNAFDEVTTWLLGADNWSGQEFTENEQIFRRDLLDRFLAQTKLLREELTGLLPSGLVNQAVFGALDAFENNLSGKNNPAWLESAVTAVFQNFTSLKNREIRELFAGGLTGPEGTDTVKTFGYLNFLKDEDASVQWTLFMPDVTRQQQDGFRMESFEYKTIPAMRFIGKEGDFPKGSPELTRLLATLDSMAGYRSGFDYDLILIHHFGRGVDVERCHHLWGRFMAAGTPVPAGFEALDFVPGNDWKPGMPYVSQFAFAKFTGDTASMHEEKGFDCDAMYDVTRNTILGQNVLIPYPDKYWTAEVYLDGFEKESTAYLFSIDKTD